MNNSEISFSSTGYADLIVAIRKAGYTLVSMAEAFSLIDRLVPAMVLRHDVDFSVEYARQMARLEYELGVRSTYCFMVTSDYYNIFSAPNREILNEIVRLGHEIGLHWDATFLPKQTELQAEFFRSQICMLASITGQPVRAASQHIPTDTPAFNISPFVEVNAYSKQMGEFYTYVSYSSMAWRQHTPLDLVAQGVNIQFLTHPIWWMADGTTQTEKIRSMATIAHQGLVEVSKSYLTYMHNVLIDRDRYDKYFNEMRQASGN